MKIIINPNFILIVFVKYSSSKIFLECRSIYIDIYLYFIEKIYRFIFKYIFNQFLIILVYLTTLVENWANINVVLSLIYV